jgi:DNA-binding PadR family transcriptional regulator
MLTNDDGERVAIIEDSKIYSLTELGSEQIAELFNGGLLPLVPIALKKHDPVV